MGRLTDDLLAVVGIKPSDRIKSDSSTSAVSSSQNGSFPSLREGTVDSELAGDCLSCKVIGTTTMTATSLFVYYYTWKNTRALSGKKKIAIYGQGITLGTIFLTLAVCRALDLGPFDQSKKDEAISDRVKSELSYFSELTGLTKKNDK